MKKDYCYLGDVWQHHRVITLHTALCDTGRYEECLQILDRAVEECAALDYVCDVKDWTTPWSELPKEDDPTVS